MNKTTILPADTYNVVNKTIMNNTDRLVLTILYQPLIGHSALSLYFTFWSDLDCTGVMSIEFTHRHLMNVTGFKIEEIVEARKKLEAIGLMKTAFKSGNTNNYVYQLYAPLSASEVFTHPFLSVLLYNTLGSKEYKRVVEYFKMPDINLSEFKDITTAFSDVYKTGSIFLKEEEADIRKRENCDIELKTDLDIDLIINSIPKDLMTAKTFDQSTIKLIKGLSFLYNIESIQMAGLVRNSLNEKGLIDKTKLQNNARNFYQFENNDQLPHLIYNNQPSKLRKNIKDDSKRSKTIYTFETLSPYDFLRGKYNGSNPTTRDMKMVEGLLLNQELPPGVVNVLIDYVLRINDNKLNKNFVETIAGHWKRLNIKTVEEAMKQAEKEHKGYKTKTSTSNKKITTDDVPDWFDKKIDEDKLSVEEEEKMKAMLSEFS
ncbi:MAG: DnaD domain protein [Bacilli bacterium]|nr:DnaD domain protein [Bacilli bacterium]MDD3304762.1 DnaD domain protein [Bacilli bacterium]MDD4053784.1 DnaD domain protein [Bacilli bacterium]MDD4411642.1 DnaD domain protein [Bacilli bacterium]